MWYESLFQIKKSIILRLVYIKQKDLRKILIEGFNIVFQKLRVSVKNIKKSILIVLSKLLKFWRMRYNGK
uniref:Uncharacterized protein n=1 Tax=Siphoviridae sp. ct6d71 TaxID=2826298 RepID=A0A8S5R395_9CAUD|nr:MAG TPA: hypothetical protein [Siphoviridae sp. ct6d71]